MPRIDEEPFGIYVPISHDFPCLPAPGSLSSWLGS
jgi:hypothetical protein